MRQVVLDTETTGLEAEQGHRIIEIGCVEIVNRRLTGNHYHQYINPEREIDAGAYEVHGIGMDMLADKPVFAQVVEDFMAFIEGAELVIHNAPFDVNFIDHELRRLDGRFSQVTDYCRVIDSLVMAREKHPGQKNSLDALCKRYDVDNSSRTLHGALLDAEILADVFLAMTGGQTRLSLHSGADDSQRESGGAEPIRRLPAGRPPLTVVPASAEEQAAHQARLDALGEGALWRQ